MSAASSQLDTHRGTRIDLPGEFGPIAALRVAPKKPILNTLALLLPGFTGSKEDFVPLLDAIADIGIEPIAIDLPGQYQSPGPDREDKYLPEALGQFVADLVSKLAADGQRVLLLGHSYGGLVARGAVLAGAPSTGLTLLDSGPAQLPAGQRRTILEYAGPVLRQQGIAVAQQLREQLNEQIPGWATKPVALKDFLRDRILASSSVGLLGMADGLLHEPDRVSLLAHILQVTNTPCLVVCGAEDNAWSPTEQQDMAQRLNADFATVPQSWHSPNLENPAGLLAVLLPTWHSWLSNP